MQVHLPIAVCLVRGTNNSRHELNLLIHQVQPENTRSIIDFIGRSGCAVADLVHHVVFFTFSSYAECQARVRAHIAKDAGARMIGRTKVVVGDEQEISAAMTRLSLDSTQIDRRLDGSRAWRLDANEAIHDSSDDGFEEEDEEEESDDSSFIDDKEEDILEDDFDDEVVAVPTVAPNKMRRFVRMCDQK